MNHAQIVALENYLVISSKYYKIGWEGGGASFVPRIVIKRHRVLVHRHAVELTINIFHGWVVWALHRLCGEDPSTQFEGTWEDTNGQLQGELLFIPPSMPLHVRTPPVVESLQDAPTGWPRTSVRMWWHTLYYASQRTRTDQVDMRSKT